MKESCPTCGGPLDRGLPPPHCPTCGGPAVSTLAVANPLETMSDDVQQGLPTISAVEPGDRTYLKEGVMSPPTRPGLRGSLGRFEILHLLGNGGMGNVYLAREPMTDTLVAVKILRGELRKHPKIVKYFLAEAKHMYTMSHPNILKVLEVSDSEQGPFFVMPYLKGGSLRDRLVKGKGMSAREILEIAIPVARGVEYAHSRGIIHRDLKPDNILLDRDGGVRVGDFGLVRTVFNDDILDPNVRKAEGTPAYMSPGVAAGKAEDTRCDIYALGAVLYELLTGTLPYSGGDVERVLEAVRTGPPLPILKVNPDAPRDLVRVAEAAMARELRDRYATMQDVLADLERIDAGQRPAGPSAQRVRRSLPLAAKAAVGIAVGVGLLALLTSIFPRDREAEPTNPHAEARALLERGDPAAAEAVVRARVEVDPSDVAAWMLIGDAAMAQEHTLDARIAYDRVLRLDTTHRPAVLGLAEAFRRENNLGAYTNYLVWAKRLDPTDPEVFDLLMEQLVRVGHLAPARNTLVIWNKTNPDSPATDRWVKRLEAEGVEAPLSAPVPGAAPGRGGPGPGTAPGAPPRPPVRPPLGPRPVSVLDPAKEAPIGIGEDHETSAREPTNRPGAGSA